MFGKDITFDICLIFDWKVINVEKMNKSTFIMSVIIPSESYMTMQ